MNVPVAKLNAVEGFGTPLGVVVVGTYSKILTLRAGLVSWTLAIPVPALAARDQGPAVVMNASGAPLPSTVPAQTLILPTAPPPVWLPFRTNILHVNATSYSPGHIDDNSAKTDVADKENEPQIVLQQKSPATLTHVVTELPVEVMLPLPHHPGLLHQPVEGKFHRLPFATVK